MGRRLLGIALLLPALIACAVAPSRATASPPEAHLLFVGDLMVGRYVAAAMANRGYDPAFAALRPLLSGADLALGNLESPIMPTGTYTVPLPAPEQYVLTGNARAAGSLARAGFDLLSVANNHSFDSGLAGLAATRDALQGAGIAPVGLEQQTGSQAPVVRAVRGLRLAFLAYTAVPPNVGAARVAGKP
jgi:poly-gamma-glutamate synthesis protein (capsule biosynthesis protein)